MKKQQLLYFILFLFVTNYLQGQIIMNATGSSTQNFNTLITTGSGTWTDNSTIINWYSQRSGTGTTIVANNGSNNAGNLYSYGTGTDTERALGTVGSTNAAVGDFAHGVLLQNTSGSAITDIQVSFTLEQWRNSAAVAQTVSFYYKTSATLITALQPNVSTGWTLVPALSLSSPITGGTAGALDGNLPANKVSAANISLPGLSLNNNSYILLKWDDPDHASSDHGLAIDDVTINWTVNSVCTPPSISPSGFSASNITLNSMNVNWSGNGNGDNVLVVAKQGSAVNADPVNGTSYSANSIFGSGDQLGTGNYVIYKGAGSTVNLTGLLPNNNYYFAIYAFNSATNCYYLTKLTGNATTLANVPELQLQYPIGTDVACGASMSYPNTTIGQTNSLSFRIKNIGTANLNLTSLPLSITGLNPTDYTITVQPTSPILANGFVDVTVQFNPITAGAKTASISISNNDSDENPCVINMIGTGVYPNDDCTGAITVTCGQTIAGTTLNALADASPACVGAPNNGIWYKFVGTGINTTISLCGSSYDTKLLVYTGACGTLTCLDGNDNYCGNQSQLSFTSLTGVTYYILVTGATTTGGSFTMNINCGSAILNLSCPSAVIVPCASSVPTPNPASCTVTSTCQGGVTVTWQNDVVFAGTCPNKYTITRTYLASDQCGNTATCTQLITINDITAPSITCPNSMSVSCASLVPAPNIALVSSSDACGGTVTISFVSDAISAQTCANRYTITRTYRATDACGNSSTCTQIITVNDVTPPSITCPPAMNISCSGLVPTPDINLVTATDGCGGVITKSFVSDVISSQTCTNKYTITRTYRATDVCGNSATCAQTITVNDIIAPSISCPANLNFYCASEVPAANATLISATDNCTGTVTKSFVSDVISNQICANKYTITRTYSATDICGNSSTCAQTIVVNDAIAPTFTNNLANITIECDQAIPPVPSVSATDNCTGTVKINFEESSTKSNYQNFCNAYSYVITRKWIASDICGNTALLTQTINIQDTKAPKFKSTPPAFITVECDEDNNNNVNPIAVDGCDGNPSLLLDIKYKPYLNGCVNSYAAIYTWTAGDKCGNTAQFVQYIFVVDTTAPVIKCPENIVINSEVPMVVTWPQAKAFDYCDGLILTKQTKGPVSGSIFSPGTKTIIEYIATDGCGNMSTCSFIVAIKSGGGSLIASDLPEIAIKEKTIFENSLLQLGSNTQLLQNQPNPFIEQCKIQFYLEKSQNANISLFDINGKILKQFQGIYPKGLNEIKIQNKDLPSPGIYFYNLVTEDFKDTKKMIYLK